MGKRRILIVGLIGGSAMIFAPALAHADTESQAPADVKADASASSCIQGLSGPYDLVNTYQGISLYCGDPTKGILHIVQSHPIDEGGSDDVDVERCMNNVLAYGDSVTPGEGNAAKEYHYGGTSAVIAWDTGSKNVVTLYARDNNWARCAG